MFASGVLDLQIDSCTHVFSHGKFIVSNIGSDAMQSSHDSYMYLSSLSTFSVNLIKSS